MRIDVLDVGFDNVSLNTALERAAALIEQHRAAYVVTPNPEIVWLARKDAELAAAISSAELVLPDGIGIIYGAAILGTPLDGRVPGIVFAEQLIRYCAENGKSLFLFGAKPGYAEKAAQVLSEKYPGLVVCGTNDGYFTDDEAVIKKINAASPDFLMVCLGAPKQEIWMHKHSPELNVGLMCGLGGVIDVFSGNVERAPEAWSKAGFEWLYRLLKEPARIKRMVKLPAFLIAVIMRRLTKGKSRA